jgi:adenosine deaminase
MNVSGDAWTNRHGTDPPSDDQVRAIPKVELHVHVEGAAPPATIAAVAARNGVDLGVDDPADLYRYRDLADFLRVFDLVCSAIRTADDLHLITYEALAIAHAAGVVRREMFFSPTFVMRHGVEFSTIWSGIAAGVRDARTDLGIDCRLIMDVHKPDGPAAASELIAMAAACDREVLIGIGGDGGERGVDLAAFAEPFAAARRLGFHTTMHLGEEGPVEDVAIGLDLIGVERIDHGCSLSHDASLLALVARDRVPVTTCPTSNMAIGVVASIHEHPFGAMHRAGVLLNVSSDNAAMFGVDVTDELCSLRDAFGLDRAEIEQLCIDGADAAFVDDEERRELRARLAQR